MSRWRSIYEIARRDFLARGRSRVFLIATAAIVVLVVVGVPLLATALDDPSAAPVGIVSPAPDGLETALGSVATALETAIELKRFDDRKDAELALESGDVDALVINRQILFWQSASPELQGLLVTAFGVADRQAASADLGLTPEQLSQLLNPPPPEVIVEAVLGEDQDLRAGAAYMGVVFLFVAIVMFGQFVLLGVLEEKANRVAEVVLSRVRPVELLAGKVIGIGLLGLIQLVTIGGALVFALGRIEVSGLPALGEISGSVFASVVMWFLLGYGLYSVLFAAAGALISRQEDVQSVSWIPIMTIMPGYLIALVASADPQSTLVEVASMVPFTAPMVMLVRSATLEVPPWQLAVSVTLTLLTTYLLIRIAARVYRGGILRSGRTKLREAWRQTPV